jgi:DNA-binding transcriptional LysR family regulator
MVHPPMSASLEARIKLRHLALVAAIEDAGSLRQAAEKLGITQAAASSLLLDLEFILGTPLFNRSRSGTTPTPVGEMLIKRARPILRNVRAATDEVLQARNGDTGEVYVGMLHAAALTIVPMAIQITRREKPGIQLHVIEGPTRQLLDSLIRGDLDLVVGRVPLTLVSDLLHKEIFLVEPIEVVCRAGHALAKREKLGLADVLNADWILPELGSTLRDDFRATFIHAALQPPEPVLVTSSTVLRLALVQASDMIGVLGRQAALEHEARGTLKILNLGLIFGAAPTLLLARADAILPPAATAFSAHVREAARILKEQEGIEPADSRHFRQAASGT